MKNKKSKFDLVYESIKKDLEKRLFSECFDQENNEKLIKDQEDDKCDDSNVECGDDSNECGDDSNECGDDGNECDEGKINEGQDGQPSDEEGSSSEDGEEFK